MARDRKYTGTSSALTTLKQYWSSFNIAETAGAAAVVKIRDSISLPTACSAVVGAAGSCTAGVHYITATWVTANGESTIGTQYEITLTGSKHYTITVPTAPVLGTDDEGYTANLKTAVTGRNIYMSKAGAPGTGSTPTNAQWFLVATSPSIADNTTATYDFNLADASLVDTRPPTKDTAGELSERVNLAASESVGHALGSNVADLENDGGFYLEVTSGTVSWTVRGQ